MRLCIHYVTVFLYVTVFAFPDLIFTVSNKQVSLSRQWYVTALHGCEFSDANYHLLGYEWLQEVRVQPQFDLASHNS